VAYNLRHLRYHKKFAWAPLLVGENHIKIFQSVPEIQGVQRLHPPRFTLQKSGRYLGVKATIKSSLANKLCDVSPLQSDIKYTSKLPTYLQPPSADEVCRLIRKMPAKLSVMDSISVIKSSVDLFAPLIARLATLSFTEGTFPSRFKVASVTPLLKKKGLDCSVCVSY